MAPTPQQLIELENSGLIRLAQVEPEIEYLFRHALVQDAAYASLVRADRRALHRAVGEALERAYPDQLASREVAPLLGRHFFQAGDDERATQYFTVAGDAAARVYANAEAAANYSQALGAARRQLAGQPDEASNVKGESLLHLYSGRGQALELNAQYTEALANYGELEALARARRDRAMELSALMARAKIYSTTNPAHDPAQAQILLEQARQLAHELGDRAAECRLLWNLMILLIWGGGDQRKAIVYGEEALALARELDLREQLAFTLNDLGYAYEATDQWLRAQAVLEEAHELWHAQGNLPMLADNLSSSAFVYLHTGQLEPALAAAEEALRISRSIGNVWGQASSRLYIGHVYLERGRPDQAIQAMEEAIRLGEQVGHTAAQVALPADLGWVYGTLGAIQHGLHLVRLVQVKAIEVSFLRAWPSAVIARLHLLDGDLAAAQAALQEGYRELRPEGMRWFAPYFLALAEGEMALARHEHARATKVIDDLIAFLHKTQERFFLPEALSLKGRAFLAENRMESAREVLGEARTAAEAFGSRRRLWPILVMLSEIEAQSGQAANAQALRERAREIVMYIAGHAGTPDLRDSFLSLAHVRAALSE